MLSYVVSAIIFKESPATAVAAFDELVGLPANERQGLTNTAVVQRDPRGQIKFVQARYWATTQGANASGLFGLIIGTIFSGPVVSLMAGAGLNAFLGHELSQSFITDIQNNLTPTDTILFALQSTQNDALLRSFVPPESDLHTTTLTIEVPSALSQALAGYTD